MKTAVHVHSTVMVIQNVYARFARVAAVPGRFPSIVILRTDMVPLYSNYSWMAWMAWVLSTIIGKCGVGKKRTGPFFRFVVFYS